MYNNEKVTEFVAGTESAYFPFWAWEIILVWGFGGGGGDVTE